MQSPQSAGWYWASDTVRKNNVRYGPEQNFTANLDFDRNLESEQGSVFGNKSIETPKAWI